MNLEIHKPELVQRVNAQIESGHFHDVDELIEKALDALDEHTAPGPTRETGAVVLSGDAAHFKANFDNRRVPGFNFNQEQTVASMNRIADVMAKEHAQL